MNSQDQLQRISVARTMLESGLKPATVAVRLQVRFGIGRSTAYTVLADAAREVDGSDDGPSSDELAEPVDSADLAAQLGYDIQRALAAGDYGNATKLVNALDKVKRWGGQKGPDGPAWA